MPKSYYDVVNAEPALASYWRLGAQRTPPPFATGGGGADPVASTDEYDGYVYSDNAVYNGWVSAASGAVMNLNEPNDNVDNRANVKAIRWQAVSYYTTSGFGKLRFTNATGVDLTPYRYLVFAARSWTASVGIAVYVEDSGAARIGNYKVMTIPAQQYAFGGLRWFVVDLVANLEFVEGSMPTVHGVVIEDSSASARSSSNKIYVSELYFARKAERRITYHSNVYAEKVGHNPDTPSPPPGTATYRFNYAGNDPFNYRPRITKPAQNPYRAGGSLFGSPGADTFAAYWDAVYGDQRGTTMELLEAYSRKWGFAVGTTDPIRGNGPPALNVGGVDQIQGTAIATTFDELPHAICRQETAWRNWMGSDYAQRTHPLGSPTVWQLQSYGIGQQKMHYFPPERYPFLSTSWSLDIKCALIRAYINGDYHSGIGGSIRKALDAYYSGSTTPTGNGYSCQILGGTEDGTGPNPNGTSWPGHINERLWTGDWPNYVSTVA
jgi:hypothetical protein